MMRLEATERSHILDTTVQEEMTTMLGTGGRASPQRQSFGRVRRSEGLYRLIMLLVCFQCVLVVAIISVSVGSHDANKFRIVPTAVLEAKTGSAPLTPSSRVDEWIQELLNASVVSVNVTSTSPRHKGFELRGRLVPRPAQAIPFDGEVAFSDNSRLQHVIVLIQNRGYEWVTTGQFNERLEHTGCVHPAQVPPLQDFPMAVRRAHWGPNGSVDLAFAGDVYRITRTSDGFAVESSSGLKMKLTLPAPGSSPPTPDFVSKIQQLAPCPVLIDGDAEITFPMHTTDEALDAVVAAAALEEEECRCTSETKKRCLFLHGIGVHENIGLVDSYPDYWAKIETMLPCCSDVKFTHLNTVDSAWYDELFAQRVCDAMLAVSHNESFVLTNTTRALRANEAVPVVTDTVVVAHSTGNLHLASALMFKKCRLDKQSSKWIAIEGPMKGTNTANRVVDECSKPQDQRTALVERVVSDFDLCPVKNSTESLVLIQSNVSCYCLDRLYDTARAVYAANVYANLCGTSPFGLTSASSAKFVALATFSNHSSSENDGVVEISSCAVDQQKYTATYRGRNRFYKAAINHDDGRLIHGDGLWGDDRKPTKWLQCQF